MITVKFEAATWPEINSMIRNYLVEEAGDTPRPVLVPAPLGEPSQQMQQVAAAVGQETEAPAGGRKRRTKAEMEAARAAETAPAAAEPAATPSPAPEAQAAAGLPPATLEDARAALAKLSEAKGIQAARAACMQFDVQSIKALPPEKFGDFVAACDALIEDNT